MYRIFKISFALLLLLGACSPVDKSLIEGTWKGVAVVEEGSPLNDVDPGVIELSFREKGYAYSSTLNYKEAGTYYIDSKYLYTTDTLNQASTEKAVEIVKLTTDSLVLKMNDSGRERLLMMEKVQHGE
ncbi:MAG: lipocalin family protein [Phaeodactylibacter sp.]|nr:lipocalin family protein [Phaeodactylibacter sp.]